MRLTSTMFQTVDGVVQAPGGPDEDRSGGFEFGGWLVPYADEDMNEIVAEAFSHANAFLLGRKTYEIFAAHWPRIDSPDDPVATKLNAEPKYVVSSTLANPTWAGTTVVSGDLTTEVSRLKALPGDELQVHGSPRLVASLLDLGLLDELRLWTYPVALGTGRRLFLDGARPVALEPLGSRTTSTGVVVSAYRPGGAPQQGSFMLDV